MVLKTTPADPQNRNSQTNDQIRLRLNGYRRDQLIDFLVSSTNTLNTIMSALKDQGYDQILADALTESQDWHQHISPIMWELAKIDVKISYADGQYHLRSPYLESVLSGESNTEVIIAYIKELQTKNPTTQGVQDDNQTI